MDLPSTIGNALSPSEISWDVIGLDASCNKTCVYKDTMNGQLGNDDFYELKKAVPIQSSISLSVRSPQRSGSEIYSTLPHFISNKYDAVTMSNTGWKYDSSHVIPTKNVDLNVKQYVSRKYSKVLIQDISELKADDQKCLGKNVLIVI